MESNDNTANFSHGSAPMSDTNTSSKAKVPEWPISPSFLSLRKGKTEENANYNNDGIFYTDYLRGFLADLSHDKNVQNALSLFQFVPEDFLPHDPNAEDNNIITTDPYKATVILNNPVKPEIDNVLKRQHKKIIRIDSGTYINNGKFCDSFRRCGENNTSFCFKQDSIVGIFADELLNEHDNYSSEYRERLESLISEYNQERDEKTAIKLDEVETKKENRIYIHYTCPISLFEKHIFPIYVNGKVIACLMLGQLARGNFDINKTFSEFRGIMYDKNFGIINFEDFNSIIEYCKNDEEWEKKSQTIAERLDVFEKRIEDRIEHRNTLYIIQRFDEIEKIFREYVEKINIKKQDAVYIFTNALNWAFDSIKTKFDNSGDGFIRMFALPIDIHHDVLVPIGWTGAEFDAKDDFKFDLKQLKVLGKLQDKEIENRILEAASQTIKEKFNKRKGDIFLPGWLTGSEVAFIVWKRHDKNLKKDQKTFNTYKKALRDFYSVALECYSYIRGAKMELLLETTIQESAHESAHFILPALSAVEKHLVAIPKENVKPEFDYEKYIDIYNRYKYEVLESLYQLAGINSGESLIYSNKLKIKKEPVEVFYLLYKLKRLFSNRAKDSHKVICYDQAQDYITAEIDVPLFNHALYNLLDNAIKYGYEGSNIYINVNVEKQNKKLIIQVVSYGIGIPKEEENRVYNLFERGLDASKVTRGTGLGMYIVQKVCKAHGGSVSHSSIKLSGYNIPVLFCYKYKNILANRCSCGDISKFEKEIFNLTSKGIEQEVVNDHLFIKFSRVFSSRINMPTYENIFTITIPQN